MAMPNGERKDNHELTFISGARQPAQLTRNVSFGHALELALRQGSAPRGASDIPGRAGQ